MVSCLLLPMRDPPTHGGLSYHLYTRSRAVLSTYEDKHDTTILDPSEYEGLRALCGDHSEMELGAAELFQFLS